MIIGISLSAYWPIIIIILQSFVNSRNGYVSPDMLVPIRKTLSIPCQADNNNAIRYLFVKHSVAFSQESVFLSIIS